MKITTKQYAVSLFESVKGKSKEETEQAVEKFVKVLIKNNQTSQVEKIVNYFDSLWNKEFGVVNAEIKTAKELDSDTEEMLKEYIIKLSSAKEIKIETIKEESLLGGVILKYGDRILDKSLKNKINQFKNKIVE